MLSEVLLHTNATVVIHYQDHQIVPASPMATGLVQNRLAIVSDFHILNYLNNQKMIDIQIRWCVLILITRAMVQFRWIHCFMEEGHTTGAILVIDCPTIQAEHVSYLGTGVEHSQLALVSILLLRFQNNH